MPDVPTALLGALLALIVGLTVQVVLYLSRVLGQRRAEHVAQNAENERRRAQARLSYVEGGLHGDQALCRYLRWKYGSEVVLDRCGRLYPVAVFPAPVGQRNDAESVLGQLSLRYRALELLRPVSDEYRRMGARTGRKQEDNPTFSLVRLHTKPRLALDCELGTYHRMLDTCDNLRWELLGKVSALRNTTEAAYRAFDRSLTMRSQLHAKTPDPMLSGEWRSAAVAISTLIAYKDDSADGYRLLIRSRSGRVATDPDLFHVIPSSIFQPVTSERRKEFSVKHNILREYLEELFEVGEEEIRSRPPEHIYSHPEVRYVLDLESAGQASFYLAGVAVNLLNLRPEICTVLLIRSPDWYHSRCRNMRFSVEEWAVRAPEQHATTEDRIGAFDLRPSLTEADLCSIGLAPDNLVPSGAAAFWLGVDLLREVLWREAHSPTPVPGSDLPDD